MDYRQILKTRQECYSFFEGGMVEAISLLREEQQMKIRELLEIIDEQKPNGFSRKQKIRWINDIESIVQSFLLIDRSSWATYKDDAKTMDCELCIPSPYDQLYVFWLKASVSYANEDYEQYNCDQSQFNSGFEEFKKYAIRSKMVQPKFGIYKNVW